MFECVHGRFSIPETRQTKLHPHGWRPVRYKPWLDRIHLKPCAQHIFIQLIRLRLTAAPQEGCPRNRAACEQEGVLMLQVAAPDAHPCLSVEMSAALGLKRPLPGVTQTASDGGAEAELHRELRRRKR